MAQLVVPDKGKHKYVVGIDFGHGETSAAICSIEWDTDAGQRENRFMDIDLDSAARKKVITSAICHVADGILIGDEAFEHMTDNNGIRICFKQKPESLDGPDERLMIDYMSAVYTRIRGSQTELTDDNHIVYIARPSGWVDDNSKELYRQMALLAGIPLGGLTSESRAAIFYAKSPNVNFANEISKGAIVFDLGSSTLDFTYMSDDEKPIDFGYNLGASIIDETIYENMILKNDDVREFVERYPEYRDALKFKARKFKELAYGRDENFKTNEGFPLGNIISDGEASYDEYADTYVKLRIANLAELNRLVDSTTDYSGRIKNAAENFKAEKLHDRTVNGVFLTGGASRMNFIRPLVAEAFGIPLDKVRIDNDNPSLTISRGIALLGVTDAITSVLVSELRADLPSLIGNEQMLSSLRVSLAKNITDSSWRVVEDACNYWVENGKTTKRDELKKLVESRLESFRGERLPNVVRETCLDFLAESAEIIRKRMNVIVSRYAPGREITQSANVEFSNLEAINKGVSEMSYAISEICDSISNVLKAILWAALGVFLWGIFCAPYYIIKALRSDKSKRKDKAKQILKKKDEVTSNIRYKIQNELGDNVSIRNTVAASLNEYFSQLVENNLQKVKIPIE